MAYCADFPLPRVKAQQIKTICSCFLCQGTTFRVPMITLQRAKQEGGWDLSHVEVKCKILLYSGILTLGESARTVMSELLRY
jgi:hypothetical protein